MKLGMKLQIGSQHWGCCCSTDDKKWSCREAKHRWKPILVAELSTLPQELLMNHSNEAVGTFAADMRQKIQALVVRRKVDTGLTLTTGQKEDKVTIMLEKLVADGFCRAGEIDHTARQRLREQDTAVAKAVLDELRFEMTLFQMAGVRDGRPQNISAVVMRLISENAAAQVASTPKQGARDGGRKGGRRSRSGREGDTEGGREEEKENADADADAEYRRQMERALMESALSSILCEPQSSTTSQVDTSTIPEAHKQRLLEHPNLKAKFDEQYGTGAAEQVIVQWQVTQPMQQIQQYQQECMGQHQVRQMQQQQMQPPMQLQQPQSCQWQQQEHQLQQPAAHTKISSPPAASETPYDDFETLSTELSSLGFTNRVVNQQALTACGGDFKAAAALLCQQERSRGNEKLPSNDDIASNSNIINDGKWACLLCTLLNPAASKTCTVCESPRPLPCSPADSGHLQPDRVRPDGAAAVPTEEVPAVWNEEEPPPDGLECPITDELMHDPVMCADGHSYERASIAQWLQDHDTSPLTGAVLEHKHLIPNHALRKVITEWTAEGGSD